MAYLSLAHRFADLADNLCASTKKLNAAQKALWEDTLLNLHENAKRIAILSGQYGDQGPSVELVMAADDILGDTWTARKRAAEERAKRAWLRLMEQQKVKEMIAA